MENATKSTKADDFGVAGGDGVSEDNTSENGGKARKLNDGTITGKTRQSRKTTKSVN